MAALGKGALLAGTGAAGIVAARWAMAQRRKQVARALVEDEVSPTRRIVVLGAGFGGLYAAIRMADAFEIRNHVVDCFERASIADDEAKRRELLTFIIVGGGPTGVELAAALHDFIHHTLIEEYPNLSFEDEVRIVLFEMKSRLLP